MASTGNLATWDSRENEFLCVQLSDIVFVPILVPSLKSTASLGKTEGGATGGGEGMFGVGESD